MIIRAFPRLHIGLLDLGNVTHRRYGGAGFTLSGPIIEVFIERSNVLKIVGLEKIDARAAEEIEYVLTDLQKTIGKLSATFTITQMMPQHVGLGSKTALLMTLLKAGAAVNNQSIDMKTLQLLSGRGGTSGIGVNSFFGGGFLIDGGHEQTNQPFGPSSARRPQTIPPIICRLDLPTNWRFTLLLASKQRISDEEERQVFSENTPLPQNEVLRAISLMYHGIAPAVATNDLFLLKTSLDEFHTLGFKKAELAVQSQKVRDLYMRIQKIKTVAVGLSSMGPLLYVISEQKDTEAIETITNIADEYTCECLGTFEPRNKGFEII